ncbi:MAG: DHA2 family efflux MFS transporter permease subunit, partial [Myxococcota bacterium]|nr:DHA2 family efflux MFS transporter permease subunit [Myxococcota bacterium]
NGFNLAFAVPLITASRVADQFGRKRVFTMGLALFTLTSLLCGVASTDNWLVFFRVLQGLAAAMLVPLTIPIALRLFPAEKSGAVLGIWAAIAGIAAASGPTLGGIIADKLSWQWIFFINVPIGCVTLVMTALLIEESRDPTASHIIDWPGMLALTAGSFALVYGLIKANDFGWTSITILSLFFMAAVSFVLFAVVEMRSKEPMLPLEMLRSLPFSASSITMFFLGVGTMNGVFFLSFFLTQVMGMTELKAGLVITALPLSSTVFSAVAGILSDRVGSRWFAVVGMAILATSIYLYGGLTEHATNRDIIWRLIVGGAGIGTAMAPIVGSMIRSVSPDKMGIASGVGNMARTVGTVMGVAVIVTVFTNTINDKVALAKTETIALVKKNDALREQIKKPLLERLEAVKFSQSRKMGTLDDVLREIEKKKTETLDEMPGFMKKKMEAVFVTQVEEIRRVYPKIQRSFKRRICEAFSFTFEVSAYILIFGIISAFFCDKKRRTTKG